MRGMTSTNKRQFMKLGPGGLILAALLLIVCIIAALRVVTLLTKSKAHVEVEQQAISIRVEKITKGDVEKHIKISGTIRPANEVEIFPKLSGRITSLHFDVGDKVKTSDVLAVVEHKEAMLEAKAAQASLIMARSKENAAKTDLARARDLVRDRALAEAQLEEYELKYDVAKGQRVAAEAEADIRNQQLRNAQISSLIDGTVVKRMATVGASVSPKSPVFVVQDISKLKLVTTVDADTLLQLKKGSIASITVSGFAEPFVGNVISVEPSLDANSRRAAVEIEIEKAEGKLVPNMFVDGALFIDKLENVLTVPNKAFFTLAPKPAVFRVVDGKVEIVQPKLGDSDAMKTVVLEGLAEGDLVAITGLDRLKEGSLVTIENTAE